MVEKHDVDRAKLELMLWELIDFCDKHPDVAKSTDNRIWDKLLEKRTWRTYVEATGSYYSHEGAK